jgi:hypothetical protein
MKKLIFATLLLGGCTMIMPVPHDPVEAGRLITAKQKMETVSCIDKDDKEWQPLIDDLRWLNMYTEFRQDPQAKALDELYIAMQKAKAGSTAYCEATVKLNKTRVQVIEKAWKGR